MAKINQSSFNPKADGSTVFEADWKQQQDIIVTAINATDDEIKANKTSQDGIAARVTTAENDIDTLEGRATGAETRLTSAEGRLSSVETKNTDQDTRLTNVEGRATSSESRLNNAESRLSSVEETNTDQDTRINNILSNAGDSNVEIVDARLSAENVAFSLLKDRLDTEEAQVFHPTSADTLTITSYGANYVRSYASIADFKKGQRVIVEGAGESGKDLHTTITDITSMLSLYTIYLKDPVVTDPTNKKIKHAPTISDQIGSLSGSVESLLGSVGVLVSDYAKGDGTNEATQITNALTAGAGKVVVFPPGKSYRVDSKINVQPNTTIIAYGAKLYNTTSHFTILNLGSGCKVYGLEIEGAGNAALNYDGIGINFAGDLASSYKSNILIEDCYIRNFSGYGVYLRYAQGITINKCRIENIGYAGVMGLSVSNVVVDKSHVKGISPGTGSICYGIVFTRSATTNSLTDYPRSKDCRVTNCLIEDNIIWEALDTHAGEGIIFAHNTIRNCKKGIILTRSATGSNEDYAPQNCKIVDNTIYGTGQGYGLCVAGAKGTVTGTPNEYAYGNVLTGNTLINCGEPGNDISGAVYLRDTYGLIVANNTLKDCFGHGVNLYSNNRAFTVEGNTIIDVQDTTVTVPSGICVRTGYHYGTITGNNTFKVNAALNTYVMVRGIFIQSTSNMDITVTGNHSTADTPFHNTTPSMINFGSSGVAKRYAGNGTPEGVVTAVVGSIYMNQTGGAGTTLYIKESGSGNTGWVAK